MAVALLSQKMSSYRRPAVFAAFVLVFFIILETFYLYSSAWTPAHGLLPSETTSTGASPETSDHAPKKQKHKQQKPKPAPIKTSQLHFLLPASDPNDMVCAIIASALVNRYPAPYMIGWKGEGKYNASAAHTAKLYSIKKYLDELPNGGDDDDLVFFGDGYDVMAQLPVEVVIERYFKVTADADQRLADRFGITVEEAHKRGLKQTLFWGADKMCWPALSEDQCTKLPGSHLPNTVYGPKTGNGDATYRDAKFFNSGSVIGPVGDLRKFIDAGINSLEDTFDPNFKYKTSDQIYLARLYARQEMSRAKQIEYELRNIDKTFGESNITNPFATADVAEYHAAIDYESDFVQTGCFAHKWMQKLNYNNTDNTATMAKDLFEQGKVFKPYKIQLPANVYRSFIRVFKSLPDDTTTKSARDWIASLPLDTNVATRKIFGFYHATCSKRQLINDFKKYWFHPYIVPLLQAGFQATKKDELITDKLIDGRKWVYKTVFPSEGAPEDELGGVLTDYKDEAYIPFSTLCHASSHILDK
ncbi:hypothetical protein FVEN_g5816 [Fusarium venenatum]|uniref:Uncharacterized protein n=1 Tax=Fusarium venenatum TaxID=56646 RepID=A0A2L2TQJ1_9HYPO|nr:uncharacterized protein FVRRES_03789 [Fusarium venenatum]KAG8356518.1 hypothetical protein FVEN_g5816 [Fusarium venenatum]KAH7003213.1 hypothetical protein EDB82DRAFT_570366 [Fusarium venenatum]CEI67277.1 unnamed protein product [Fusarium venenatum]